MHANVESLLRSLGSVTRALSYGDLATLLNARDATRRRNASTVQRWIEGTVPDLTSIKVMADLAGVTFEEFALGASRPTVIAPDVPVMDHETVEVPDPRVSRRSRSRRTGS